MGQTYDPQTLQAYFTVGLQADLNKAKGWYVRAVDLGDHEAMERLRVLDATK